MTAWGQCTTPDAIGGVRAPIDGRREAFNCAGWGCGVTTSSYDCPTALAEHIVRGTIPRPMPSPMPEQTRVIPRRAVVSWITYDLANVIFSMGVTSLNFSLFVRAMVGSERADSLVGPNQRRLDGHHVLLLPAARRHDRSRATTNAVSDLGDHHLLRDTALIGRGPFA